MVEPQFVRAEPGGAGGVLGQRGRVATHAGDHGEVGRQHRPLRTVHGERGEQRGVGWCRAPPPRRRCPGCVRGRRPRSPRSGGRPDRRAAAPGSRERRRRVRRRRSAPGACGRCAYASREWRRRDRRRAASRSRAARPPRSRWPRPAPARGGPLSSAPRRRRRVRGSRRRRPGRSRATSGTGRLSPSSTPAILSCACRWESPYQPSDSSSVPRAPGRTAASAARVTR